MTVPESIIFLSCISLVFTSFQDVFNNKKIDERKNWFMSGMVSFAYIASNSSLFILISYLLLVVGLSKFLGSYFGKGDIQILGWLLPSHYFFILFLGDFSGFISTGIFLLIIGCAIGALEFFKRHYHNPGVKLPGVPILLAAQLITSIIMVVRL